jgi:CheY-like chemotaxis protein
MTAINRLRILIVDDCADAADSLAMLVRLWGHEARVAYDGAEALAVATAHVPDVMLLDLG